jgi:hypothetical protein
MRIARFVERSGRPPAASAHLPHTEAALATIAAAHKTTITRDNPISAERMMQTV